MDEKSLKKGRGQGKV